MKKWLALLLAYAVGAFFIWSGVGKVKNPVAFAEAIRNYRILTDPGPAIFAHYLPWFEVFLGIGVIWERTRQGAAALLTLLLLGFLGAITSAWIRGLDISCGCFGAEDVAMDYPVKIAQNVVLIGVCIFLWTTARRLGKNRPDAIAG